MNYYELNGKTIREGFEEFNKNNPDVYREFKHQALRAIGKGRTKISAKLIINWIRWNKLLTTPDDINFKINDAYQSYFARKFAEEFPEYASVFNFRKLRNEEKGQYMEVKENGKLNFL